MIRSRGNHPSIVQWETFNEQDCYGVFVTPPHSVADVVALARRTDWQGRPVDTDSGGGANYDAAGDVNDVHSYPYPGNPLPSAHKYAMIGEFGGIGTFTRGKEWVPRKCFTYLPVNSSQLMAETYVNMTARMVRDHIPRGLASSIYTQVCARAWAMCTGNVHGHVHVHVGLEGSPSPHPHGHGHGHVHLHLHACACGPRGLALPPSTWTWT